MPEYIPDELFVILKYLSRIKVEDLDSQKDAVNLYTAVDKLKTEVDNL